MKINFKDLKGEKKVSLVLWCVLVLSVVLIFLFVRLLKAGGQEVSEEPAEKAVPVKVIEVKSGLFSDSVILPGRVESLEDVDIAPEKQGLVVELPVDRGDTVGKGQLLLKLDDSVWVLNRRRAEIEKNQAEKDVARWLELKKKGAVSESEYDAIQTRMDLSVAALDAADVEIRNCEVRSPIKGRIEEKHLDIGEYARDGATAFRVVNTEQVKVLVNVPEQNVRSVRLGDVLNYIVSTIPGRVFSGKVTFVSNQARSRSNSFEVEVISDNADGVLKGGMIAEVTLVRGDREDAIVLPLAAVVPRKGRHMIFVARGDRAVAKVVTIDLTTGHEAVIRSGIDVGEMVIIEGHRGIADGSLIRIEGAVSTEKTEK